MNKRTKMCCVTDSSMSFYDQNLLVEMECPICMEFMHPPIRQCVTGHSFCTHCFFKLKKCPTCRQSLSKTARSFALERLHSKLAFPCKNREVGCGQIEVGSNIIDHELICSFGVKKCPLKVINDCQWRGQIKDIVGHCKDHHPHNIFCTNKQRLTCSNFLRNILSSSSYFYIIFHVYDEFFKCAWEVNFDTGYMRWCVFQMGDDGQSKFNFEVEIENQNNLGEKICLRGRCPLLKADDDDPFNNTQFLISHYDMIKTFCKDDDLIYIVNIIRDEAEIL